MNQEKALKVLEHIKEDLSRWDQTKWTNIGEEWDREDSPTYKEKTEENQVINCGTTACIAGHASFIFAPVGTEFYNYDLKLPVNPDTGMRAVYSYNKYGSRVLELNYDEADYLFAGRRTWKEITEFITATDERRHQILVDYYGGHGFLTCGDPDAHCPFPN